jgi:hypothetical protein
VASTSTTSIALASRVASGVWACRWGVAIAVVAYALLRTMYVTTPVAQSPGSDGFYTWLYTRSIVFDHDIDFANDYALCGDPHGKNLDRGTGHRDNPFYVGPTVIWAPILWAERSLARLPPDAPDSIKGACWGPLVAKTLSIGPVLGALTIWLMYRIARRWARDGGAALAAGLLGLCSSLPAYATMGPSYSHVHDAFWAGASILASLRAAERPRSLLRWALAGAFVGIGMLQRPVSVVHAAVPAALAAATLYRERWTLVRALGATGIPAFAFGMLPQMLIYKYLYGSYWAGAPHGRFFMQYGHAHPWLVLFAPHGGLFYVCPAAWLAVFGATAAFRARDKRVLMAALLASCAAAVWLSAASIDWTGSGTFGARRLTSMLPLLAAPTALALERIGAWLRAKPGRARVGLGVAILVPAAFTILGATYGLGRDRVPTEVGLSQADLYGTGDQVAWGFLDEHLGDVAVLPAEIVFHLRYGLAMNAFRDATEPRYYYRDYRTMVLGPNGLDLTRRQHAKLLAGFVARDDGEHIDGVRGSLVFAAFWPYATGIAVTSHASEGTRLKVGRGGPFGTRTWFGEIATGPRETTSVLPIPRGGFDSGLVEIVFERIGGPADVAISAVTFEDTTRYPPPL